MWLKKKEPEVGGYIGGFGLSDWWLQTFTPAERKSISQSHSETISPVPGQDVLASGPMMHTAQGVVHFLWCMAGNRKEKEREIDYRIIQKAEELIDGNTSIEVQHFVFGSKAKIYYRWRETDDFAMDTAIEGCRQQIAISKEAARALEIDGDVPAHYGFKQLTIIEEKRGNHSEAIRLCEQAKADGWWGDWDKRITRLRKKSAKAQKG